jgi:glutamate racemase
MSSASPIVVLDSGLGGLTVVRALLKTLPAEQIVYFGDTARLPYGTKSAATVATFVSQIISYLLPLSPKHVVMACNTATALALPATRCAFPGLPISGVIEPGAKAAVAAAGPKQQPVIGVIATEATIRSNAYAKAIHRRRQMARLMQQATPLLAPMVEEGRKSDDPLVLLALKQYLDPMLKLADIDVLVLGCTHYPLIKDAVIATVGPSVSVIDSAEQCAQDVAHRLRSRNLTAEPDADHAVPPKCFVTDDAPRFGKLAERFLGMSLPKPVWVPPEELYRDHRTGPSRMSIPA